MGQSGSVGSHTVNVWRSDASAVVRSLLASGAATPPAADVDAMSVENERRAVHRGARGEQIPRVEGLGRCHSPPGERA